MNPARSEAGQILVTSLLFLTVLLGFAAVVVDVGAWLVERWKLQSAVDSAALAAAQGLGDTSAAASLGGDFASRNNLSSPQVSFSTGSAANDTVTVHATRKLNGFFSLFFGKPSVDVHAGATAHAVSLGSVRGVAPIAVRADLPVLECGEACLGQQTTIRLRKSKKKGAAYLIKLAKTKDKDLLEQITNGYPYSMKLGTYKTKEWGELLEKEKKNKLGAALQPLIGHEFVLPVYKPGKKENRVDVVTWVTFTLTGYRVGKHSGTLEGFFSRLIDSGKECVLPPGKKKKKHEQPPACDSTIPLQADQSVGAISISLTD